MVDRKFFYELGQKAAELRKKTLCHSSGRNVKTPHIDQALQVAGNSSQSGKGVFKWRSGSKRKA